MKGFEDLVIWKDSINLTVDIYKALDKVKDYSLKDQIQRASTSISFNISEGYERHTKKEFIQFLYYAKGSCGEIRTGLILAQRLEFIDDKIANSLIDRAYKLSIRIHNFIEYIQKHSKN
ncbi:four helix bundle protein [Bacteroidia bacterium]|nr:four helix bundle protein [Bacteroidia bacterium]